jgi:hypothetical protein
MGRCHLLCSAHRHPLHPLQMSAYSFCLLTLIIGVLIAIFELLLVVSAGGKGRGLLIWVFIAIYLVLLLTLLILLLIFHL